MNRILRLIQKDTRRFWSYLLLLWAVMQLACYVAWFTRSFEFRDIRLADFVR